MGGCNNTKHDTTAETKNTQTEEQVESDGDASDEEASKDIFAMDTYMTVTAYGDQAQEAVDEAGAEIERLDNLLSTGNEESEIAKLNQSGSATLSEDAGYLVERALELNEETDGAFDINAYWLVYLHEVIKCFCQMCDLLFYLCFQRFVLCKQIF